MQGFFDFFSSSTDVSADRADGMMLLEAYYNTAASFADFGYSSFADFLAWIERGSTVATDIGELVRMNNMSTTLDEAKSRLTDLASKSRGKATASEIVRAAGGTGDTVNWYAAAPAIAEDVAETAVETAGEVLSNVGTGVLGTLKLVKYLPYVAVGVGALYLYLQAKKKDLI